MTSASTMAEIRSIARPPSKDWVHRSYGHVVQAITSLSRLGLTSARRAFASQSDHLERIAT